LDFKELIFVSGKGGTGKTTLAAVLARHLALKGKRTLLVELERRSSLQALLEISSKPQYQPSRSGLGFDWSLVSGLDCLVEYISSFTGLESLTQKIFDSVLLKSLVNVAPGLNDLAVLGKLTSHIRQHGPSYDYEHIVVDAPSTGSFFSLMNAPKTLGDSVSQGPLHTQSFSINEVLTDPSKTQLIFVSLFEELPVDELEDTLSQFNDFFSSQMHVIMNKKWDLERSEAASGEWKSFIDTRLSEEKVQEERVKQLWDKSHAFPLFTENFNDVLANLKEELLCPL
jgi:anion-transporting  ArsA/GET3 family ATPase